VSKASRRIVIAILIVVFTILITSHAVMAETHGIEMASSFNGSKVTDTLQVEPIDDRDYTIDMADYPSYEEVAENESFMLYLDQLTGHIAVYVKDSGYAWFSLDPNYDGFDAVDGREHSTQIQNRIRSNIMYRTTQTSYITDERHILNVEHDIKYTMFESGFDMHVDLTQAQISFDVIVRLTDHGLDYDIPFDRISEQEIRLQSLRIFPGLGATTGLDMSGYLFIPDGSGALIRYDTSSVGNAYVSPIYGDDLGYQTSFNDIYADANVKPVPTVKHPVIGIVHGVNHNAMIAVIDEGAHGADIRTDIRNNVTKYFTNSFAFNYRNLYLRPINNQGAGLIISSPDMDPLDVSVSYIIQTGDDANYAGMAKAYRDHLDLPDKQSQETAIPMHAQVIAMDVYQGLFRKRNVVMTDYQDMEDMLLDLSQRVDGRIDLSYHVKEARGDYVIERVRALGSKNAYDELEETIEDLGVNFHLFNEYTRSLSSQRQIAKRMGGIIMELSSTSSVFPEHYALDNLAWEEHHETVLSVMDTHFGLAMTMMGQEAYSHVNQKGDVVTRAEMIDQMTIYLEALAEKGSVLLSNPNRYAYPHIGAITDYPVMTSGFNFVTDSIPFFQIAFSNSHDLYSEPLNFASDRQLSMLQMIEYNMYPAYVLTEKDAYLLKNSDNLHTFTSEYTLWKDTIAREYATINQALKHVRDHAIMDHRVIAADLVMVEYDNDVRIYVNYSDEDIVFDGITIKALDYFVLEVSS
jgi:hypothetical protein